MIQVEELQSAGTGPVDCSDPRVLLLNSRLQEGVALLKSLRAEGVAKTNFMQCDERSIYVFEHLFTSPLDIINSRVPPFRRSHNHTVVRHLINLLVLNGEVVAATEVSAALEECDPIRISDLQASTELRVCHMVEAHRIIFGILSEVLSKGLSAALQRASNHICLLSALPTDCRPGFAYLHKDRLISLVADNLLARNLQRAGEIVLNQKGRPIW